MAVTILGPGECAGVQVVADVKVGPASMIDATTGATMAAVAVGLTYVGFDVPHVRGGNVFLLSREEALDLLSGLAEMLQAG